MLFFGVDNDGKPVGLANAQSDAEFISRRIKDRITPLPDFILTCKTCGTIATNFDDSELFFEMTGCTR